MENTAIAKTRVQTRTESAAGIDAVSKASIGLMAGVSSAIGLWSVACLAAALFSNGPVGLLKGAITAVTGL